MLTIMELFVLNRAIDGNDIIGLPSFSKFRKDPQLLIRIEECKANLINKDILLTTDSLTRKGVRLLNTIDAYKGSGKYVRIQGTCIALTGKDSCIVLRQVNKESFEFRNVNFSEILDSLAKVYQFLNSEDSEDAEKLADRIDLSPREAFKAYFIDSKSGFAIQTYDNNRMRVTSNLFYALDQKGYQYNCKTHTLHPISFSMMRQNINFLVNFEGEC
jgi:hypothetical protein